MPDSSKRRSFALLPGTQYETQVHVYQSGESGPTTLITGGLHGDEVGGMHAARSLSRATVPRGTLVVIPVANQPAKRNGTRHGVNGDLNRKFPGNQNKKPTSKLAAALWSAIKQFDPDWHFDLHTSRGLYNRNSPSNFDGVGQMAFTTAADDATSTLGNATAWVTKKFSLDSRYEDYDYSFRSMVSVDGTETMLADRFATIRDPVPPGSLLEATEDETTAREQADWIVCLLSTVMAANDQQPEWDEDNSAWNPATDGSDDGTNDESEETPPSHVLGRPVSELRGETHELEILPDGGGEVTYEFTVAGRISAGDSVETTGSYPESVTEHDDGTTVITGSVHGSYADAFKFDGPIISASIDGDATLALDGSGTRLDTVVCPKKLVVRPGTGEPMQDYSVLVKGDGAPALYRKDGSEAGDTGERVEYTKAGSARLRGRARGGHADTFYIRGAVVGGSVPNDWTVTVDGDVPAVLAPDEPEQPDSPVSDGADESEPPDDNDDTPEMPDTPDTPENGTDSGDGTDSAVTFADAADAFAKQTKEDATNAATQAAEETAEQTVEERAVTKQEFNERIDKLRSELEGGNRFPYSVDNGDIPEERRFDLREYIDDPQGEEQIDPLFGDLMQGEGNVAFGFPPNSRVALTDFAPTADNIELHGFNTTIVPTPPPFDPNTETIHDLIKGRGDGFVMDGFEFDMNPLNGEVPPPQVHAWADNFRLGNLVWRGPMSYDDWDVLMEASDNGVSAMTLAVTAEDGVGKLHDVYQPNTIPAQERDNARAIFVKVTQGQAYHRGRLEIKNWWVENFAENTYYGDYGSGTVHMEDIYVRNSPVGLRIPGGSSIERLTAIKDKPVPHQRASLWENEHSNTSTDKPGSNRTRGIWLRAGNNGANNDKRVRFEDIDLIFTDDTEFSMGQPIVLSPPGEDTDMRDIRIKLRQRTTDDGHDVDRHDRWPAVVLDDTDSDSVPKNPTVAFHNFHIDSDSEDAPAIEIQRTADITSFNGVVSCPCGVTNLDRENSDLLQNMTEGQPQPPDPAPTFPEPPEKGTTPNGR